MLTISMGGLKLNAKKSEVQFMHEKVPKRKKHLISDLYEEQQSKVLNLILLVCVMKKQ